MTALALWAFLISALPLLQASPLIRRNATCKCLPEDPCWPKPESWTQLNSTLGGRLIATQPLAAPCHFPSYNETECELIKEKWEFAPIQ
jgi:hypothetical protein